ncbi:MAG: hypothetical protein JWQ54_4873 [Mucilaginibacter sp.]|nr:hypothetical protein [Mucilaginibacter sp.]
MIKALAYDKHTSFIPVTAVASSCCCSSLHDFQNIKDYYFNKKTKTFEYYSLLAIPFVWSALIYYILKKEPDYFDKRRRISNDYYESDSGSSIDGGSHCGHGGGH